MKRDFKHNEPFVAIDIGTTKICVLVARSFTSESFEILGMGKAPSHGLSKGVVVDINKTVEAIAQAVQEASIMSGVSITHAAIGVSGSHIQSMSSHGMVSVKKGAVSQADIDAVMHSAQAVPLAPGKQLLHVLPKYFILDGQERVQNPLGMHAVRLEVQAHIVLGAIASVQNLVSCCEQAGVIVQDIVLEQIASGMAVLSADERALGVGVLDIGGGTSDFALYLNNAINYTVVIPVAGNHFTNDLAMGLRITLAQAEKIKKEVGSVSYERLSSNKPYVVESVETGVMRTIAERNINTILYYRAHELCGLLHTFIKQNNLQYHMSAGLVLTGGSSLLDGLVDLASHELEMSVRLGKPYVKQQFIEPLESPLYATAYGLLHYVCAKRNTDSISSDEQTLLGKITGRMKSWVSELF